MFGQADTLRSLGLARVSMGGRTRLKADHDPSCLDSVRSCLKRSSVASGDIVVTGHTQGAYTCIFLPPSGAGKNMQV